MLRDGVRSARQRHDVACDVPCLLLGPVTATSAFVRVSRPDRPSRLGTAPGPSARESGRPQARPPPCEGRERRVWIRERRELLSSSIRRTSRTRPLPGPSLTNESPIRRPGPKSGAMPPRCSSPQPRLALHTIPEFSAARPAARGTSAATGLKRSGGRVRFPCRGGEARCSTLDAPLGFFLRPYPCSAMSSASSSARLCPAPSF